MSSGTVTIIGLAVAVIGVGVRLIAAFKPPQSQRAKNALGYAGYALIVAGGVILLVLVWVLYIPITFQLPVKWNTAKSGALSAPPTLAPTTTSSELRGDPLGAVTAVEFVQLFEQLQKPCTVKITGPSESQLASVLRWILTYGGPNGGPGGAKLCEVEGADTSPPNVDEPEPPKPTTEPGIVIHWNGDSQGERVAHYFDADGFRVRVSHRLPKNSPTNLIWIDIGPGSPWK